MSSCVHSMYTNVVGQRGNLGLHLLCLPIIFSRISQNLLPLFFSTKPIIPFMSKKILRNTSLNTVENYGVANYQQDMMNALLECLNVLLEYISIFKDHHCLSFSQHSYNKSNYSTIMPVTILLLD